MLAHDEPVRTINLAVQYLEPMPPSVTHLMVDGRIAKVGGADCGG